MFNIDFDIKNRDILQKSNRIYLMQEDANSTRVLIQCPRFIDGIDILDKRVYIIYKNNLGIGLSYSIEKIEISSEKIIFGWWIEKTLCETIGNVDFQLVINNIDDSYIYQTKTRRLVIYPNIKIIDTGEVDGALLDKLGDYLITIDGDYLLYKEGV